MEDSLVYIRPCLRNKERKVKEMKTGREGGEPRRHLRQVFEISIKARGLSLATMEKLDMVQGWGSR